MIEFGSLAVIGVVAAFLIILSRYGITQSISRKPALILCVAAAAGCLYQMFRLPDSGHEIISDLSGAGLGALVFVGALQFRLSRLGRQCPAALCLAVIAAPLFMMSGAISAFIILPNLSIWSALLIGGALMLNGAAIDRRAITSSLAPLDVKRTVELESAAALVFGLPLVIIIELMADAPFSSASGWMETGIFRAVIGFALGGSIGLIGGMLSRRASRKTADSPEDEASNPFIYALLSGLAAFLIAPLFQGEAIIAAGAAGLIWSEEGVMSGAQRRLLRQRFDQSVKPMAYALFGFTLGPAILQADILILMFAIAAVTILRVVPRLLALSRLGLSQEQQNFIAWFGGAPGAASALYMIKLRGMSALIDQEMVLTIGVVAVFVAIIGTRLSSRPLVSYFIRQNAVARKRRYYTSQS